MSNAELFVSSAFLVSIGVVACRFATCTSLLLHREKTIFLHYPTVLVVLSLHRVTTLSFFRPFVAPL